MKKFALFFLLSALVGNVLIAQNIEEDNEGDLLIEGKYSGKNIVVLNPSEGENFCIDQVWVNGRNINVTLNSNSFEIPLEGFMIDQIVSIQIHHHANCVPVIVNAYDLIKEREFTLSSFNFVKRTRLLSWEIKDLDSSKTYSIEQYVFGKWISVKELGSPAEMAFNTFAPVVNSGINFFRLKETDEYGKVLVSQLIKVKIPNRNIEIKKFKVTKDLEFTDITHYEIITENGFFVISGVAKSVDVSALEKGNYFVNFDGKQAVFVKK